MLMAVPFALTSPAESVRITSGCFAAAAFAGWPAAPSFFVAVVSQSQRRIRRQIGRQHEEGEQQEDHIDQWHQHEAHVFLGAC